MLREELLRYYDYESKYRCKKISGYCCDDLIFVFSILYSMNLDKEDLMKIDVSEVEKDVKNASVLHTNFDWGNILKETASNYKIDLKNNTIDRNDSRKFVCENIVNKLDFKKKYSFQEIYSAFVNSL